MNKKGPGRGLSKNALWPSLMMRGGGLLLRAFVAGRGCRCHARRNDSDEHERRGEDEAGATRSACRYACCDAACRRGDRSGAKSG